MRTILVGGALVVIAFVPGVVAAQPSDLSEAFLYYARRPDAAGDVTSALAQSSLFTGSATTSIPIEIPRGTNGVQPSLSLEYSSSRGYGDAGYGWSLELGRIARSTKYGSDLTQTWSNANAVFVFDGEELIRGTATETDPFGCVATRYYRKPERFQKILFCQQTLYSGYWTVLEKDGTRATYGRTADSRLSNAGVDFEYFLDEVRDTHGLSWKATYVNNAADTYPRLTTLAWTYHNGVILGEQRTISIQWSARPDGVSEWVDWKYGFASKRQTRISSVLVQLGSQRIREYVLTYDADDIAGETLSPDSDASVLRKVQLFGVNPATDSLPAMTFTYKFNATNNPGFVSSSWTMPEPGPIGPAAGSLNIIRDLVDLNGDGYLDYVDASTASQNRWVVRFGSGYGGFGTATNWTGVPSGKVIRGINSGTADDVAYELVDMNADGRPDLYTGTVVYFNTGTGFGTFATWTNGNSVVRDYDYFTSGGAQFTQALTDLVDVNGDGCPDRLSVWGLSNKTWRYYRSLKCDRQNPQNGFASYVDLTAPNGTTTFTTSFDLEERSPALFFAQKKIALVDVNKDGIPDLFNAGTFSLGTGRGFKTESGSYYTSTYAAIGGGAALSYMVKQGWDKGLLDVNGDGRLDVVQSNADASYWVCVAENPTQCQACVYHLDDSWTVWLNTGHGFRPTPIDWAAQTAGGAALGFLQASPGTQCAAGGPSNFGSTRVLDWDSDGTPDFFKRAAGNWTIHQNRSTRGELLVSVENGVGGETLISYEAAIGARNGGVLHFPVQVVSSTISTDGMVSDYSKSIDYSAAYFDAATRSFAGFESVDVTLSDGFGTPTRTDRHLFASGRAGHVFLPSNPNPACNAVWQDGPALVGREFAVLSGPAAGSFEQEVWTTWEATQVSGAPTGVVAAFDTSTRTRTRDLTSGTSRFTHLSREYDTFYGNVLRVWDDGEVGPAGNCNLDYSLGNDGVKTVTSWTTSTAPWIVGLPYRIETCSTDPRIPSCSGGLLRRTDIFYDSLAAGSATKGDPTSADTWIIYPGEATGHAIAGSVFDAYGNLIQATSPTGAITTFAWDDQKAGTPDSFAYRWKESTTVSIGKQSPITLETSFVWDERFGIPIESLAPNTRKTITVLDGLGRSTQLRSTPPDDPQGAEVVLAELQYFLGGMPGGTSSNYVRRLRYPGDGSSIESRTYFDGLLRTIQTKQQAENNQWITTNRRFTWAGSVHRETLPYFASTPSFSGYSFGGALAERHRAFDWAARETSRSLKAPSGATHWNSLTSYTLWDTVETDPRSNQKLVRRDARGRASYVEERSGSTPQSSTNYYWGIVGNLNEVKDTNNVSSRMYYDSRGLKRRMEDPDSSNCVGGPSTCPWLYSFDLSGRLIEQTDAAGNKIGIEYDELGRKVSVLYAASDPDVFFSYDSNVNARGLLSSIRRGVAGVNELSFGYDNWGRPLSTSRSIQGALGITWQAFDRLGRATSITYPGTGETATYTFGAGGALETLTFAQRSIVTNVTYDALGRATQTQWGNGLSTDSVFEPSQKVDSITVSSAGSTQVHFEYDYDLAGNTRAIYEDVAGWSRSFTYDWANSIGWAKRWRSPGRGATALPET